PPVGDRGGPKRPWYLIAALLFAWVFGAAGFIDGCNDAHELRQGYADAADHYIVNAPSEASRVAQVDALQHYFDAKLGMSGRLYPLSIAAFLLGATLTLFAARAMAGRSGARNPVIQLTLVQAALVIAAFALTRPVREAWVGVLMAQPFDTGGDTDAARIITQYFPRIYRSGYVVFLVVRTAIAAFIVIAITRPRTRKFFEAAERRFSQL
ncbi:MAG: hypothetical protein ABI551_05125, partial [Polyangiaceae bacterium]